MELRKILFSLFCILSFTSLQAQKGQLEYGVGLSPSLVNNQNFDRAPAANFAIGLFANYNFTQRVSIGGAIEYQQMNLNTTICDFTIVLPISSIIDERVCNIPSQDAFQLTRFPLWLSINLNDDQTTPWQSHLILGYAFGKLNNAKDAEELYGLPGLRDNVHFGKLGLEFKKVLNTRVQMTLGSHLNFTNLYDDKYGNIQALEFVLRFGII